MSWDDRTFPQNPPLENVKESGSGKTQEGVPYLQSRSGVVLASLCSLVVVLLLVVGGVVFALRRSSSEESADKTRRFEQLTDAIESGEVALEDGYMSATKRAFEFLATAPLGSYSISSWQIWERSGGTAQFRREVRDASSAAVGGMIYTIAELTSLPFSKDPELDRARDLAVEHYEAWKVSIQEVNSAVDRYFSAGGGIYDDFPSFRSLPAVFANSASAAEQRISPTFRALCTALSDAQPPNGKFEDRVRDICDD